MNTNEINKLNEKIKDIKEAARLKKVAEKLRKKANKLKNKKPMTSNQKWAIGTGIAGLLFPPIWIATGFCLGADIVHKNLEQKD